MNPGCGFAQPGAILPPALRAGFARRRRARSLARGERAKRATPGTRSHENRTPTGVRGLRTAVRDLDSSGQLPLQFCQTSQAVIDRPYSQSNPQTETFAYRL